jgi:hypothetical protein
VDTLTFRVRRKPQVFVGAFGLLALLLGALLVPRGVGWFALAIGAVCTLSGLSAIFPNLGCVTLVVEYAPGWDGRALGQRLRDGRSYVGNFTTASGDELALHAGGYLARYGFATSPTGQATPVPPSPQ